MHFPALSRTHVVYYTSFATDFAWFAFLFSITRWLAETGSSTWHLGLFGACASVSYAVSGPLSGWISDRFGPRRVMLTGAAATVLVLITSALWRSRPVFYAMAVACGIAVSLIYPPLIAWLTEDGQDTSRRLFLFCIAWNVGVIAAQLTSGWLYVLRPELPLLASVIPIAGIVALMWRGRPSPPEPAVLHPVAAAAAGTDHDASPRARAFVYMAWLSNAAGSLSFSLVVHLFPSLALELGISPPLHGAMLALNRLAVIGTYFLMYRFTYWRYRLWTAIAAQALAMVGLAILGFASSTPALTLGLILTALMLGYNYFASIYYSTRAFRPERKGLVSGIHEASLALGGGLGALGGGLIGAAYGVRAPYRLCVALLALFVAVQWTIYRLHVAGRTARTP